MLDDKKAIAFGSSIQRVGLLGVREIWLLVNQSKYEYMLLDSREG
jgi:hypothetical protein